VRWGFGAAAGVEVDEVFDLPCEELDRVELLRGELSRLDVEHAQRSDREAARMDGHADVRAQMRLAGDVLIGAIRLGAQRVGDDDRLVVGDDAVTERDLAIHQRAIESVRRLGPLVVLVDEGEGGHRHLEGGGQVGDDLVECGFARRSEQSDALDDGDSFFFE
jgi:hypothetical protein